MTLLATQIHAAIALLLMTGLLGGLIRPAPALAVAALGWGAAGLIVAGGGAVLPAAGTEYALVANHLPLILAGGLLAALSPIHQRLCASTPNPACAAPAPVPSALARIQAALSIAGAAMTLCGPTLTMAMLPSRRYADFPDAMARASHVQWVGLALAAAGLVVLALMLARLRPPPHAL